jgi:hypothetical protein
MPLCRIGGNACICLVLGESSQSIDKNVRLKVTQMGQFVAMMKFFHLPRKIAYYRKRRLPAAGKSGNFSLFR